MQGTVTTSQKRLETWKHSSRPFPTTGACPVFLAPLWSCHGIYSQCGSWLRSLCGPRSCSQAKRGKPSRRDGRAACYPSPKAEFPEGTVPALHCTCPAYAGQAPSHPSSTSIADRWAQTRRVSG